MHAFTAAAVDGRSRLDDGDAEDAGRSEIVNKPSDLVQTNRTNMVNAGVPTSRCPRPVLDVEFG
jgi:hypothetical protein